MATTANRAYRYPLSTDDVRPYEDIQFLATDVDADVQALYAATWVPYNSPTLAWTGSATNPALGNGTLVGRYQLLTAKMVRYQISLTIGTTTTFGTGFWIFSVPFNASADAVTFTRGTSMMNDLSTQSRPGVCRFNAASQLIMDMSSGVVNGTSPVAAAASDNYVADIIYDRV